MRDPDPGQDEKASVVCGPVQMLGARAVIPSNELIARSYLPGGSTEEKAGHVTSMAVAGQVREVLSDRAAVAQIMVTGKVAGEGAVVGMLGVERFDSDWGEFMQAGADGRGQVIETREFGRCKATPYRCAPWGREYDQVAAVQFEQQRSGGHIFEPPVISAPIPNLSEFPGETSTMPVRVGSDQVPDVDKVLFRESAALNM